MRSKVFFFLLFTALCINAQNQPPKNMVLVEGGPFMMGKTSDRGGDFSPAHSVKVNSFFMDIHEVTNIEYLKFCEETNYKLPEFWNVDIFHCGENYPDYPVVGVNWYDAMKYAQWAGKRLPTEAEWEYAARGGLVDNEFPNGNEWDIPLRRNHTPGEWENLTVAVGSFDPNGFGLYDMAGNVWEWTLDNYQEDYYGESPEDNPTGPEKGTTKAIRGGSWHSGKMCHKVYFRKGLTSNWVDFGVGFRCVKDANNMSYK